MRQAEEKDFRQSAAFTLASTQINLTGDVATALLAIGRTIPDADLAADGRETEPHVTVKYGLLDDDPDPVRLALAGESVVELTFGDLGHFAGVENGTADAVFVEVQSPGLARLHQKIADGVECAPTSHKAYAPHATVAYVKPGLGVTYAGPCPLTGRTVAVNTLVISNRDGSQTAVRLGELRVGRAPAKALRFRFDVTNPAVVKWAKRHAATLVKDVTETTKQRIRTAIARHAEDGDWNVTVQRIYDAVGDEDRAELIARHESHLAASEGQRQAWGQAVEQGLLTGEERRVWIITPIGACEEICQGLDNQQADLRGLYTHPETGEEYDGPPAHVNCRCTEGLL